jgi:uncharacterized protein
MRLGREVNWGRSRLTIANNRTDQRGKTGSNGNGGGVAAVEESREIESASGAASRNVRPQPGLGFRVRKQTAIVSRWLHIYLSMVSFAVVLFFAATGLTLNHPDWFGEREQTTTYKGTVAGPLLHEQGGAQPDKLGIVEFLRNTHKIKGAVSDFRVEDDQVSVSFKGPGYAADGFIQRDSGRYELVETRSGFVAVINDLHKGRDTGKVWSGVIDASAILLVLVSLSGLVLIWFVYKRRVSGLVLAVVGGAICMFLYRLFVP